VRLVFWCRLGLGVCLCNYNSAVHLTKDSTTTQFNDHTEHWLYGSMLRRTHNLLGGGTWSQQYVADWWACDSSAGSSKACAVANMTAPAYTKQRPANKTTIGLPKPSPKTDDVDDLPVVEPGLLNEPLLAAPDNWGSKDDPVADDVMPLRAPQGSGAGRQGGEGGALVAAAALAAAAVLAW